MPPNKSRQGLTRCPECGVHIEAAEKPGDTECPFCGAGLLKRIARRLPSGRGGLIAASLLALSGSAVACGDEPDAEEPTPIDGDTGGDTGGDYGVPPDDPPDEPMYGEPPDGYGEEPGPDVPVAEYGVPPE